MNNQDNQDNQDNKERVQDNLDNISDIADSDVGDSEYDDNTDGEDNDIDYEYNNDDDDNDNNNNKDVSCSYNLIQKKRGTKKVLNIDNDNDDDYDDDYDEFTLENKYKNKYVPREEFRSRPILTKYEYTNIFGKRITQLQLGAKAMIMGVNKFDPKVIAQLEIESGMIPYKVSRILPDGKRELWKFNELKLKPDQIKYGFTGSNLEEIKHKIIKID
jgi:DNA-directed RNA polymerase subunit K/omega